jgi:hypothetical protein
MLTDTSRRNKENQNRLAMQDKEPKSLLQATVGSLKEEIQSLQLERVSQQRQYLA